MRHGVFGSNLHVGACPFSGLVSPRLIQGTTPISVTNPISADERPTMIRTEPSRKGTA